MSGFGCRIRETITRPDPELIQAFRGLPVANIDDCMNRMAAVDFAIRPRNQAPLLGCAFTVRVPEGDNLMFHKAMDLAKPGDVILIDAGGSSHRAIFGELMATYCQKRGIAGLVVDGAIRDEEAIRKMELPVYARAVTPNGPYKNGPGEINEPISIGGRVVFPGDIVVGDQDGLVIIRPEDAKAALEAAKAVSAKEAGIYQGITEACSYVRPWVDEKLKELGY